MYMLVAALLVSAAMTGASGDHPGKSIGKLIGSVQRMDVYTKLTDLTSRYKGIVVALGMFDGVHIGHQSIVRRAIGLAREQGGTAMVFTFSNHPLAVLAPQALPPQIGNNLLRQTRLAELGVDVLMAIPFTRSFAGNSPEEFLQLLRRRGSRCVVGAKLYVWREGQGQSAIAASRGRPMALPQRFALQSCGMAARSAVRVSVLCWTRGIWAKPTIFWATTLRLWTV